ncbi:hypothetical protein [Amycolatopsis vastitatis]|uniref:hypothetical protein n=1 Tax=Amycolatopsis vastitatis TaxID=1905142 RepID=UPI001177BD20|nr:hypothetical protein [Amycolatopsis vastitatis]
MGSIATQLLVERGALALENLDEREGLLGMAEQFLVVLEVAGPVGLAEWGEVFKRVKSTNVHPLSGLNRASRTKDKGKKRRN